MLAEIHRNILDYLIFRREWEPELHFAVRKTNKYGRKDKGYYFLGSDEYVYLSFWDGVNWEKKIHNIGFAIFKDGSSYIELSAENDDKLKFIHELADELGGFSTENGKIFKKDYESYDYLQNLNHFITEIKPLIDSKLKSKAPIGITFLDSVYFESYVMPLIDLRIGTLNIDEPIIEEVKEKNTEKRFRSIAAKEIEFDPLHDRLQNSILKYLREHCSEVYNYIKLEDNRVDVCAKTKKGEVHFFEVKTDNPKLSIRKAIGQLMEYAYFPAEKKAEKLYIVTHEKPDSETIEYLKHIRNEFKIPIYYKFFDLDINQLSEKY